VDLGFLGEEVVSPDVGLKDGFEGCGVVSDDLNKGEKGERR